MEGLMHHCSIGTGVVVTLLEDCLQCSNSRSSVCQQSAYDQLLLLNVIALCEWNAKNEQAVPALFR